MLICRYPTIIALPSHHSLGFLVNQLIGLINVHAKLCTVEEIRVGTIISRRIKSLKN